MIEQTKEEILPPIILKKSHKYLSDTKLKSLPHGRINKTLTGIGATTFEIEDKSRNSIIVCPTVSLASSKAIKAIKKFKEEKTDIEVFYLGSDVPGLTEFDEIEFNQAVNTGKRIKVLAVVDSFVNKFDSTFQKHINKFHLLIDEADTLQMDSRFRPVMDECMDIYFTRVQPSNRTMISATLLGSVLEEIKNEPLTYIIKKGQVKPTLTAKKITGYLPYYVGREIKERLYKNRNRKIVVAANSFDLMQEIMVAGKISEKDVSILCSDSSEKKAGYLKGELVDGKLPPNARVVFMTSAYYKGIDIEESVIVFIVSDVKYKSSLLSVEQIYQVCGRARDKCLSRNFFYNTIKGNPKVKDLKGLTEEMKNQEQKLQTKKSISGKTYLINIYNSKSSGSFFRLFNGKLKPNLLLFDMRLQTYKMKKKLYGKNSTPKSYLEEYFTVEWSEVDSIPVDSNKAKKLKKTIKDYKVKLFKENCLGGIYGGYSYNSLPFMDGFMELAHSLQFHVPDVAREKLNEWLLKQLDAYKKKPLEKMADVLAEETIKKLLQELEK
jgi:hypothetical protein